LLDIWKGIVYYFTMIWNQKKARVSMKSLIFLPFLFFSLTLYAEEEAEKAPSFSLKSMENKTVYLDSLRGNYVVIDFWAVYCKGCVLGLDAMKDIFKTYDERGLIYLAINEDGPRNVSRVPGFVKGHKWEYTILYDPHQEVQQLFGIQAIPEIFIIDKEGNIIFRHNGYKKGDEKLIRDKLEELLPENRDNEEKEPD
jgi:cytochrome c biogenesis protein CcmG/thiol:disulfide interchange protein DsbE